MDKQKLIYRIDDNISFRLCSLRGKEDTEYGDCTNFYETERNWTKYYGCNQSGIHFHCSKHPEIEMNRSDEYGRTYLMCPRCGEEIEIESIDELRNRCLRLLNIKEFKGAKLVRLDDWYVHEIKEKIETESNYWIKAEVKTDRDNDTIIVLYVGYKGEKDKTQFFIKPEKLQLSSDHHDLDPATVISQISVVLKDRQLLQKYDE